MNVSVDDKELFFYLKGMNNDDFIENNQEDNRTLDEFIKKLEENAHKDKNGVEYWSARDLQKILGYTEWRKFSNVIEKAKLPARVLNRRLQTILSNWTKWFYSALVANVQWKILI